MVPDTGLNGRVGNLFNLIKILWKKVVTRVVLAFSQINQIKSMSMVFGGFRNKIVTF